MFYAQYPLISSSSYNDLNTRVTNLEGKYVRTTRFAVISSGTSGAVTLPSNATVILDDFGGTVDAIITTDEGSKPSNTSAVDSTGNIVATTFDSSGNYVLTEAPTAYPIIIVYRVEQKLSDFDSTAANIWGQANISDALVTTGIVFTPSVNWVNPGNIGVTYGRYWKGTGSDTGYMLMDLYVDVASGASGDGSLIIMSLPNALTLDTTKFMNISDPTSNAGRPSFGFGTWFQAGVAWKVIWMYYDETSTNTLRFGESPGFITQAQFAFSGQRSSIYGQRFRIPISGW